MNVIEFSYAKIRVHRQDGKVWFKATDLATALGFADPHSLIRKAELSDVKYLKFDGDYIPTKALSIEQLLDVCRRKRGTAVEDKMKKVLVTSGYASSEEKLCHTTQ